jgi:hypothetical protein
VLISLSDATERPPLRIENRTSAHTLVYRIGDHGDIVTLEPMR